MAEQMRRQLMAAGMMVARMQRHRARTAGAGWQMHAGRHAAKRIRSGAGRSGMRSMEPGGMMMVMVVQEGAGWPDRTARSTGAHHADEVWRQRQWWDAGRSQGRLMGGHCSGGRC